MSVEQTDVIDLVGVDKNTGNLVLTISDHLPWDDANEHLLILQEKINTYLGAIEHGRLEENYPAAKERRPVISLVMLHHPNSVASEFLDRIKETLAAERIGFIFAQKHFNSPP